jgi:hypothetical protein
VKSRQREPCPVVILRPQAEESLGRLISFAEFTPSVAKACLEQSRRGLRMSLSGRRQGSARLLCHYLQSQIQVFTQKHSCPDSRSQAVASERSRVCSDERLTVFSGAPVRPLSYAAVLEDLMSASSVCRAVSSPVSS